MQRQGRYGTEIIKAREGAKDANHTVPYLWILNAIQLVVRPVLHGMSRRTHSLTRWIEVKVKQQDAYRGRGQAKEIREGMKTV